MGSEIFYKETNSLRAINNITDSDYRLGIIRYQDAYDGRFRELLAEKELEYEVLFEFSYLLLFSEKHPLASKPELYLGDLSAYTEIAHADPFVPSMPLSTVRKNEVSGDIDRHIYVFERGSQMDILSESANTFMWSPRYQTPPQPLTLWCSAPAATTKRNTGVLYTKRLFLIRR